MRRELAELRDVDRAVRVERRQRSRSGLRRARRKSTGAGRRAPAARRRSPPRTSGTAGSCRAGRRRRLAPHGERQLPEPLRRLRADGDRADEHALLRVGEEPRRSRRASAARRSRAAASPSAPSAPRRSSLRSVPPSRPRVGEDRRPGSRGSRPSLSARHVCGGDARLVLADVREERDAGDVAERPDVLRRAQPLVDLDPALGRSCSRAARGRGPPTFGRRPVATSRRSASTIEPSASVSRMPGSTFSTAAPVRTSMPSSRKTSCDDLAGLRRARGRGGAARARSASPSSPCGRRTARARRRRGRRPSPRGSRAPRASASRPGSSSTRPPSSPSTGGIAGDEPVATTSRSYSSSRPSTSTTPGRATRAVAAHERAALLLEPLQLVGVVPVARRSSRATARRPPRRAAPVRARARGRATTRARRRAASSSSACTRSTSTRRRRAGSRRA